MKEDRKKGRQNLHLCVSDIQMSEAFVNNMFLAFSGGLQDAYTYNTRDGVFSNAQTGNVVLMSQLIMSGKWQAALHYLFPLIAFIAGVIAVEGIQGRFGDAKRLHWRQGVLLTEILILFGVGFIPLKWNIVATVLVSFSCAMQVQAFRKVRGYAYASTMCIGNMRSGTEALSAYIREKNPEQLKKAGYYFGIILFFAIGAGIGGNLSVKYGISVIWICCVCLLISFCLMFVEKVE